MPLLMIFLAALHRLTSNKGNAHRPGQAVGVLLDRDRVWWYKKIDPGFVVVPVVSFHRLEFFSPAGALVFMAGAFIIRLWCGYRAPVG